MNCSSWSQESTGTGTAMVILRYTNSRCDEFARLPGWPQFAEFVPHSVRDRTRPLHLQITRCRKPERCQNLSKPTPLQRVLFSWERSKNESQSLIAEVRLLTLFLIESATPNVCLSKWKVFLEMLWCHVLGFPILCRPLECRYPMACIFT